MDLTASLYVFMTALFSALIMVPFLRRWALDAGAVDTPDGRKVHTQAVPRVGGLAISMAFLFSLLVYVPITREVRGILAGTLVIFFTGLIDDLHGLTPKRKVIGEIGACLVAMTVGGLYLSNLGDLFGFGPLLLPAWMAFIFTIFAVVGVINAINLIDGLDGLAGGISVIALTAFLLLALQNGQADAAALAVGLLGGVLGFLKYNFYPARIFMGDTGSLVVGFVLGFLAVLLTQRPGSGISPMVPVLVLGLPIVDTLYVMTRRLFRRSNPFAPDMTHLHHKFLDLGFQHRFTVLIIYGISLFWAIFSILFRAQPEYLLLLVFVLLSALFYLVLRYILRHREKFPFFSRDSPAGLRESVTYRRLAERTGFVTPVLLGLLILYFAYAAATGGGGAHRWQLSATVFLAGVGLLYQVRDARNDFLLAMSFLAALVIAIAEEKSGSSSLAGWMTLERISDYLLISIAALVATRFMLRRPGEFFLSTADFLILALAIFLGFVFLETGQQGLSAALPKGIVLFLAVKTVAAHGLVQARTAIAGILITLAAITIRSYFGV